RQGVPAHGPRAPPLHHAAAHRAAEIACTPRRPGPRPPGSRRSRSALMAIRFEQPSAHPGVAVVTIDRPEQANSLDPPSIRALADAWRRVRDDSTIRVAVLTGAGERVFCGGMDMKTTIPASQRLARGERLDEETFAALRDVSTAILAGFDVEKPVIAAVN